MRYFLIFFLLINSVGGYSQKIYINEVLASNTQTNYDSDFTEFSDWIELYNPDTTDVDISGYYLTDNRSNILKWQIPVNTILPAKKHLLLWADGTDTILNSIHTNFKLSKNGETIYLYSPTLNLIDSIKYIPQAPDISFGRITDGDSLWGYFFEPTPGQSNNTEHNSILDFATEPVFSLTGGLYQGQQTISVSAYSPTAIIKYTLNGSIPDKNSNTYINPITIDTTTIIRARVFDTLMLPSRVITHTYLINVSHSLPVISVVTDSVNLWGDTIGIYCTGTNGISNYGVVANYWHNWERPFNFEMFENNGTQVINQIAGIAIKGERRIMEQKSFNIFARNKYGKQTIEHKIFNAKNINEFTSVVLRNGGLPDFTSSMIRDGLCTSLLINQMDIDYQAYRQSVLYINGKYWGIYNIREKQNEDYLAANHNTDPANLNILENGFADIVEGTDIDYNILKNFIANNNLNDSTNYAFVKKQMDIDEYINYQIAEIYMGNYDWPYINIKFWKPNTEKGKWRWMLYDLDPCFALWGSYNYNNIEHATDSIAIGWPNDANSTLLFRNLLKSKFFREEFIQRMAAYINTTFSPARVHYFIDSLKANIQTEMPAHINRWKDYSTSDGTCIQSMNEWENNFAVIREFADLRPEAVRQHITDKFNLSGTFEFTTNANHGHIEINTVDIPAGTQTGIYFKGIPLKLKAIPDLGYRFVGWQGCSYETQSSITITLTNNNSITALFVPANQSIIPPLVDNDTTLYLSKSPYIALGDIVVDSNKTLTIEAGVEIYMPDSACFIVYGKLIINGTDNLPVTIDANKEAGASKWGAICFYNATDTGKINNLIINNATNGRNKQLQIGAISSYNSNLIIDNTYIDNVIQPFYSEYGNIIITNSEFRSEYTCDLINIKYANSAIVENCNLRGNEAPDTDAIDYDGIAGGIIKNNKIYGFFGFNSDGIDIGEEATNITIENNIIFNCTDKGISVGQASSVFVKRNLIYNCNMGVGVKDSLSYAYIDQNTFFNNDYSIACFEKNYNSGGGSAEVKNSILASSTISPVLCDEKSTISVSYSISNTKMLQGINNYYGNPLFTDTLLMNFELLPNSPCIDTGDPLSPLDPDNTIADIGAYYTYKTNDDSSIVINEINYNSNIGHDTDDWLELYNNSNKDIDMSGWILMDNSNQHIYNFPENFTLKADELIVLCSDIVKFTNINNSVTNYRGNINFRLNDNGEMIRLFDAEMNIVDFVEYDDKYPWPTEPDGFGATLELINPDYDNKLAENWNASKNLFGSPGQKNNIEEISDEIISGIVSVYPNPVKDIIEIKVSSQDNELGYLDIQIYNIYGQSVMKKHYNNINKQFYETLNISHLGKGLYVVSVCAKQLQYKIKILKI